MYPRDERGVSEVLGTILIFGLLVSGLAIFQINAVPAANEAAEFEHSQRVEADLLQVESYLSAAASSGGSHSSVVETGMRYPERFLFVNPGPAGGTFSTEASTFAIDNATALGEAADYWNGTERSFDTRNLVYQPGYNYYDGPLTTMTAGVVYNTFGDGTVLQVDDAGFVSGDRLSFVVLSGDRYESNADTVTLEMVPLSAPARTVSVTDSGGPVVVRITTDLSAAQWATFLDGETVANGGNVQAVRAGPAGTVEVVLQQGVTYDLYLSKVAIGSGSVDEDVAYVTLPVEFDASIPASGGTVGAVARDQFNNPVPGVELTFTSTDGTFADPTVVTDENGLASTTFTPDANISAATVFAGIDADGDGSIADEPDPMVVTLDLTILASSTDYTSSEINPDETPGSFVYTDAVVYSSNDFMSEVQFQNLDDERTVTGLRVSFYSPIGDPGHPKTVQTDVFLRSPAALDGESSTVGGTFIDFGTDAIVVPNNGVACFRIEFVDDVNIGDLYGITLTFSDGSRSRYFVQPTETGSLCDNVLTADAGGPYTVAETGTVTLDGSGSAGDDPIATYQWSITNDPTGNATITDTDSSTPQATFNAPSVTSDQTVQVELVVTDANGVVASETTTVTVNDGATPNQSPTADFTITEVSGNKYDLDASSSSDADGSIATYEWDLDGDGQYDDDTGETLTRVNVGSGDTVGLRVTDNDGAADTVTMTVP